MIVRNILAGVGIVSVITVSAIAVNAQWDNFSSAPPRLVVSYKGLDLRSADGVDALERRIARAVRRICVTNGTRDLAIKRYEQRCSDDAWASVRPQVDAAIERARGPQPAADSVPSTILTDIEAQPSGIRRSIRAALTRAFNTGITANWYGWGARGLVFASGRTGNPDRPCRFVTVTSRDHGVQQLLTRGVVCLSDEGLLSAPTP